MARAARGRRGRGGPSPPVTDASRGKSAAAGSPCRGARAHPSVSFTSMLARLSRNCASVRPPMITDVTPGRRAARPARSAPPRRYALRRSPPVRRRCSRARSRRGPAARFQPATWRVPSGSALLRRCLPESSPPAIGLHDQNASFWSIAIGNEFVFGFARLQRIVNLLRHERDAAIAARDLHRFHHVPAGPVRAADVAHLARAHETVERLHRLLERGQAVPLMHLIKVDDVGAAAA